MKTKISMIAIAAFLAMGAAQAQIAPATPATSTEAKSPVPATSAPDTHADAAARAEAALPAAQAEKTRVLNTIESQNAAAGGVPTAHTTAGKEKAEPEAAPR